RTDEVDVPWVKNNVNKIKLPNNLLAKGAESDILKKTYLGEDAILKKRVSKSYRISEIDDKIRKMRTKSEAKLISDIKSCGVRSPVLYDVNLEDKSILMESIKGN